MATPTFSIKVYTSPPTDEQWGAIIAGQREITSDVLRGSTSMGRSSPVEKFGAATATIEIDNTLGQADPYHGLYALGDRVWVIAESAAYEVVVADGVIDRTTMTVGPGRESTTTIEVAPRPYVAATVAAGTYTPTSISDLLTQLRDATGYTSADLPIGVDVEAFDPVPLAITSDGTLRFIDVVDTIGEALGGAVYPNGVGWSYVSRGRRTSGGWSNATNWPLPIGDGTAASEPTGYGDQLRVELTTDDVINSVDAEPAFGVASTAQHAESAGSIALVGRRDLTRSAPFSSADLAEIAAAIVARYNGAYLHPREVTIRNAELEPDEILPILLSAYFSTVIVPVTYRPPSELTTPRSDYYFIDGRTVEWDAAGAVSVVAQLAPVLRDGCALFDVDELGGYGEARYA